MLFVRNVATGFDIDAALEKVTKLQEVRYAWKGNYLGNRGIRVEPSEGVSTSTLKKAIEGAIGALGTHITVIK